LNARPAAAGKRAPTLYERLQDPALDLTPAERKLARMILANYPVAGLGTVATLARRAAVSDPTVVRFAAKLGFASFTGLQHALLSEVEQSLRSPLMMMEVRRARSPASHVLDHYTKAVAAALQPRTLPSNTAEFDRVVDALLTCKGRVLLLGGRFSGFLAGILDAHLRQLRPGAQWVQGPAAALVDLLVDLGPNDLLVVFDYRRYQSDVVSFARQARERGTRLVLFTDRWGSPIARLADMVLAAEVEGPSSFDTMVPALVQVEALIHSFVERSDRRALARLEALEVVRKANRVTDPADATEAAEADPTPAAKGRR